MDPRKTGMEKRILIVGKSKGETLLDATLGEGCFERVARTGIAVSIWEEAVGPNGEAIVADTGGVSNARTRVYMMQMKSVSRDLLERWVTCIMLTTSLGARCCLYLRPCRQV
jgi:hypothetical protein